MPKLNIIVAVAEGRRLYAALETGMAAAALGRPVRIFLQGEAAALLRDPVAFSGDEARRAAGQPDLAWLVEEAIAEAAVADAAEEAAAEDETPEEVVEDAVAEVEIEAEAIVG